MAYITQYPIEITRGTDYTVSITLTDSNGDLYSLADTEYLILGVKRCFNDKEYLIEKTSDSSTGEDGEYYFSFVPSDTENLPITCQNRGCYFYDIGYVGSDGTYTILIGMSPFILIPNITSRPAAARSSVFTMTFENDKEIDLYFDQSVPNGVTVDWGDMSATATSDNEHAHLTHSYSAGSYTMTITPDLGVEWTPGHYAHLQNRNMFGLLDSESDYSFPALTSAVIYGVSNIHTFALYGCTSLSSIIVYGGGHVGSSAFAGCTSLADVIMGGGLINDSVNIFYDCTSIQHLTIGGTQRDGDDVIYTDIIGDSADLITATLANGVTVIDGNAFADRDSLTTVTIPKSVYEIGEDAFSGCTALANVYYKGTTAQWASIEIGSGNEDLMNAAIHYGS